MIKKIFHLNEVIKKEKFKEERCWNGRRWPDNITHFSSP